MDEEHEHWIDKVRREHEESLTVGTRVRIDLGECPHVARWHGTVEQGQTGRIIGRNAQAITHPVPDGHCYAVVFDWQIRRRVLWSYAAHELTPIPELTPEEIVAETLKRMEAPD